MRCSEVIVLKVTRREYGDRVELARVRGMTISDLVREELGLLPEAQEPASCVEPRGRHLRAVGGE